MPCGLIHPHLFAQREMVGVTLVSHPQGDGWESRERHCGGFGKSAHHANARRTAAGKGLDNFSGPGRPAREHEEPCFVSDKLVKGRLALNNVLCRGLTAKASFGRSKPHSKLAARGSCHGNAVLVPFHEPSGPRELDIGLKERTELVKSLAEQDARFRVRALGLRCPGQLHDHGVVVRVVGKSGSLNQQPGIGFSRRFQSPGGNAQRVVTPPGTPDLDNAHAIEHDRPTASFGHSLAEHYSEHRVGETQLASATVEGHRHKPDLLQSLEHLRISDSALRVWADWRAKGQHLERSSLGPTKTRDSRGNDLVQSRRSGELSSQAPDPVFVHERSGLPGSKHQLPKDQHISSTRRPQSVDARTVDRRPKRV